MRFLLRSILAAAMLLQLNALLDEVEAASPGTCNNYLSVTKARAARAQELQCGFWGGWTDTGPRRWCNAVREKTISDALHSDGQRLGKCQICRGYSDRANQAARDNVAFRCGFSGNRWGFGGGGANDGHFQWCMGLATEVTGFGMEYAAGLSYLVPFNQIHGEQAAREKDVAACIATARDRFSERDKADCEKYALDALEAALINQKNNCGAAPVGRWTLDKEAHVLWCLPRINKPTERAEIDAENSARFDGMEACKAGGKLKPNGDVLWKGPPIRALGKRKVPAGPGLRPDQIETKPEERPRQLGKKKDRGSGGATTSACSSAMDRLGGCGSGHVPNLAKPPQTGSSGLGLVAPSPGKPKTVGPAAGNVPAVAAAPRPSAPRGPALEIDYGGAPKQSGTKVR